MAGQKFEYDESGSTFLYFLISFLGLVLLPSTFYFWPADSPDIPDENSNKNTCQCNGCSNKIVRLKKPERWKGMKKNIQRIILLMGWCFLAFLIYKVQEFDYEYANFDPYDILGVGMQASQAEIKRAYRKLSLLYHPDKSTGDEKKFMKLNKAYQALTDDVARRNYELYGNPDGPGAMNFGIALPSWIVEKENSLWVLGVYTLVFMIGLPTAVAMWWYRSSKFSNDQVLVDTTQLYYYFFHKTPQMVFKRALMVLAASLEYERGHNPEIMERPSDNTELPALIRLLPYLSEKNKERPLCFPYSIKARALFHAHLARINLREDTLDLDRYYVVKFAPALINEMVSCVSQLIMLAHAGRISRLPSLDTIEATMKLSPHIIQAVNESKSPLLQLPYVTEDILRHFVYRKRTIKTIQQFLSLSPDDRCYILKSFDENQFADMMRVCASFPLIQMTINYEVIDDEDEGVFTAGAIVTVTVLLQRTPLDRFSVDSDSKQPDRIFEQEPKQNHVSPDKEPGWRPPQMKKGPKANKKKLPKTKKEEKNLVNKIIIKEKVKNEVKDVKENEKKKTESCKGSSNVQRTKMSNGPSDDVDSDSNFDSEIHSDESIADDADTESHRDEKGDLDDDEEWERFQKGLTKREKVLEAKSKVSHSVHCPYFTEDKQEFWWVYVCDRKKKMLITAPFQVTNLISEEEVQLKFTAPAKPGIYTYQVCIRSDCYIGFDLNQDIKLDVKEAREIPTAHPQWQECSSSDEGEHAEDSDVESTAAHGDAAESDFTTDSDLSYDSD